jgi:HEAT repeat protein
MDSTKHQTIAGDEESRRLAVAALAGKPVADVAPALLVAMGDASWRVRKEAVEILLAGELTDALILQLVDLLASEENAGLRNSASEALERLGQRAVPGLCISITAADPDVRKFVVDILGAIGAASAVPFLLPALDDPEPNVVAAVVETLGKIGDPAAVPALIHLLQRDDLFLRFTILEALSHLKCPVPLDAILPLMENSLLKKAVFDCLGAVGTVTATPVLLQGVTEKGRSARESAIIALMRLRDRLPEQDVVTFDAMLHEMHGSPVIGTLLTTLETAEMPFKRSLVRLLGLTGDSRAMVQLLKASQGDEIGRECQQALRDIGGAGIDALVAYFPLATETEQQQILQVCVSLGIRTCGAILAEGARSPEAEVRAQAIAAVGQLALVDLVPMVAEALEDQDPEVQAAAVSALVRLARHATGAVLPLAMQLAESPSPRDRSAAARLLFPAGGGERLYMLLKDEEASVRTAAVAALAQDDTHAARNALTLALMDETPEVRMAAANTLGAFRAPEAVNPLTLLLDDRDQRVQRTALRNLGLVGDPRAVPAIANFLERASGLLRIHAMESLVALAGSEATAIVEQQLASTDEEIVKAAIFLLAAADPQRLAEHHGQLLQHDHWEVRSSMARALGDAMGAAAAPLLQAALAHETDEYVKSQLTMLLDRII